MANEIVAYTLFTDPTPGRTMWPLNYFQGFDDPAEIAMASRSVGGVWSELPVRPYQIVPGGFGEEDYLWQVVGVVAPPSKHVIVYTRPAYPVNYGYGGNRLQGVDLYLQARYPLSILRDARSAVLLNNLDLLV